MANKAWVTLVTNDTYGLGALVLAHSLKKVNTTHKLVVLISSDVTFAMRGILESVYNEVKQVDILDSKDAENLRLLARPELGITFTKLHCWKLTHYEKCVFLDADTLVLQNCDELFEREELSAAPDIGWPDCFNSGVFVFKPSEETFKSLLEFAVVHGSFDGGDQGLLNMYFKDWAREDANKRLPFLYNLSSAAIYSYLPAFKWYGRGVKIVHFIGNSKPWLQPFNPVTSTVEAPPNASHLQNFLQYWWDLFCSCVHQHLSPEMTRLLLRSWYTPQITIKNNPSRNNPMYSEVYIPESLVAPEIEEHFIFTDPWEEFEKNMANVQEPINDCVTRCDYNNVQNCDENKHNNFNLCEDQKPTYEIYECNYTEQSSFEDSASRPNAIESTCQNLNDVYVAPVVNQLIFSVCDNNNCSNNYNQCNNKTELINVNSETCNDEVNCCGSVQIEYSCDKSVNNNYSSLHSLKNEILREENDYSESNNEPYDDAGLANSLSQMKIDEATPEQKAREDFLRRQNWEHGNIDYMGRDSFNNIWEKISETMNFKPETKPEETTSGATKSVIETATPSSTAPDSANKVEPSIPESCPKPSTVEEPLVCPRPPAKAQSVDEAPACPKPTEKQPVEDLPSCPKPPKAESAEQPSCPRPPKAESAEQPSCPRPPKAESAEQPSCPRPPKVETAEQPSCPRPPKAETAEPPSCPRPPKVETAEPPSCPRPPKVESAEQPSCPRPPKAEPTEPALCPKPPTAQVQEPPSCPKPAADPKPVETPLQQIPPGTVSTSSVPVSVPPQSVPVESQPAPAKGTPQIVEKQPSVAKPSGAQEASQVCQKPTPSTEKVQTTKTSQEVGSPAEDPKTKGQQAPAKPSGKKN